MAGYIGSAGVCQIWSNTRTWNMLSDPETFQNKAGWNPPGMKRSLSFILFHESFNNRVTLWSKKLPKSAQGKTWPPRGGTQDFKWRGQKFGLGFFGPGIFWGFVGSPREFFGSWFLLPFDHPRHLKARVPPGHGRMRRIVPSRPSFPASHFSLFFSVSRDLQCGTNLVNARLAVVFFTLEKNLSSELSATFWAMFWGGTYCLKVRRYWSQKPTVKEIVEI